MRPKSVSTMIVSTDQAQLGLERLNSLGRPDTKKVEGALIKKTECTYFICKKRLIRNQPFVREMRCPFHDPIAVIHFKN